MLCRRPLSLFRNVTLILVLLAMHGVAAEPAPRNDLVPDLTGRTVGILIADGFHGGETQGPITYLTERGATVLPIGVTTGEVTSGRVTYEIARTVDDAGLIDELDAVVIPGGSSPAKLRQHEAVLAFARRFAATGKPLGAICHGPQVLISAGLLAGRRATCVVVDDPPYVAVRNELIAAGATYVNEEVVLDGNLITSRLPDDVIPFSAAVAMALRAQMIPAPPAGGAWIGDFGHYLTGGTTDVHLLNASGEPFAMTLHRYNWVMEPGTRWNQTQLRITIAGPDGVELVKSSVETHEQGTRIEVPAGGKGVYTLRTQVHGLTYWHMSTTLPHAVASASREREFTTAPIVPRRWYFYVPEGTDYFTLRTWGYDGRSQREDHGLTIRSPLGQRMGALWDNPSPMVKDGKIIWGRDRDDLEQVLHIVVEPGSDGRFWSLEVQMGDAHIWSNFPVALERVPPWLAAAPEQWFNPETGETVAPKRYEETPYVRKVLPDDAAEKWPHFAHWMPGASGGRKDWMPAPALGSNASNQLRTPSRFALWNPEGRPLTLYLWDYVPRDPVAENRATVRILDAAGELLETTRTEPLDHGAHFAKEMTFTGVRHVEVTEIERFWAFTYPGTPAVLTGEDVGGAWHRFRLESGARRHWYYRVPAGTTSFRVRVNTGNPADIVALDVNAPDRTVARLHSAEQSQTVMVPRGLDDRIWHLSIGVSSATRYYPVGTSARNPVIDLDLDLQGLPPYLAPTWEQWFDPREHE